MQNVKYRAQHVIPLEEVSVRLLEEGEGETEHGWVIHTREKSFTVYAATRGEKAEWISAINRVSQHNTTQPLTSHLLLHHPDHQATAGRARQGALQGLRPGAAAQQLQPCLLQLPPGVECPGEATPLQEMRPAGVHLLLQ